jgi:hypothetical protein
MWEIDPETGEEYWVDLSSADPTDTWGNGSVIDTTTPYPEGQGPQVGGLNDFWKNLTPSKIMDLIGPLSKTLGSKGVASLLNSVIKGPNVPRAYPGGIPNLVANREQLAQPAQGRRPGSGGVTYFSPMTYSKAAPAPAPAAGMTDAQLDSIGAFLQTNPTPEALAAAMQKFGVSQADVDRARARLGTVQTDRRGTATTAPAAGSFVVGGTPTGTTGTTAMSDAQLDAIGKFLQTNPTPAALAAAMQKFGVSQADVTRARSRIGSAAPAPTPAPGGFVVGGTPTVAAAPTPASSISSYAQSLPWAQGAQSDQNSAQALYRQSMDSGWDANAVAAALGLDPRALSSQWLSYAGGSPWGGFTPGAAPTPAPAPAGAGFVVGGAAPASNPFAIGGSPTRFAQGGIATLGYAKGRLLDGPGDGVSDSIPATINGTHPAALADGEYVIPARIVSELGNGSTKAGAQKLDAMMKRIQSARRKATNIAANTRVDKHLPA